LRLLQALVRSRRRGQAHQIHAPESGHAPTVAHTAIKGEFRCRPTFFASMAPPPVPIPCDPVPRRVALRLRPRDPRPRRPRARGKP
jgi:hypothetical protein